MKTWRNGIPPLLGLILLGTATGAWSQVAGAGVGADVARLDAATVDAAGTWSRHQNLQSLPEDITVPRLARLMKRYEKDLGVACSYCHVENRETGKLDYVSDDNPKKNIARIMIAMLDDINDKHLSRLGGDQRYSTPVTCGSCHLGRANPQAWEARRR